MKQTGWGKCVDEKQEERWAMDQNVEIQECQTK